MSVVDSGVTARTRRERWPWWGILIGGLALSLGGASPWVGYDIAVPSTIAAGHSAAGLFHWSGALGVYLGLTCCIVAVIGLMDPMRWGRRLVFPVMFCAVGSAAGAFFVLARWPQILATEEGARAAADLLGFGDDVVRFLEEGAASGIPMHAGPGMGPWIVLAGVGIVLACSGWVMGRQSERRSHR